MYKEWLNESQLHNQTIVYLLHISELRKTKSDKSNVNALN